MATLRRRPVRRRRGRPLRTRSVRDTTLASTGREMASTGRVCRVLCVEDEALVSMLVEDMLSDLGVEIVGPVATLEEALAYAREADIDAAVLDINVGGLLTYPVAEILQARGVPIIFSTGYG